MKQWPEFPWWDDFNTLDAALQETNMNIPQPRNTVVLLDLVEKSERKQGGIVVPLTNELYSEAEVIAIGPGSGTIAGGHTETHDLKVGQLVFVQAKKRGQDRSNGREILAHAGITYILGDKTLYLHEQTSIFLILAEPGEWKRATPEVPELDAQGKPVLSRRQQLMN